MTAWSHSDFGVLLRRHRRRCGLSQQALAERSGLSVDAIAALERGRRRTPRAFTVQVLADAMGLVADERHAFVLASSPDDTMAASGPSTTAAVPYVEGSFVGRDAELAALADLLGHPGPRLVSVVGPAGVGKSRLAIEAAHAASEAYGGAVYWLTLMSVSRPGAVANVVATALGIEDAPGTDPLDALRDGVGDVDRLLVLDSCEHVRAECAAVVDALLAGGHGLRVLATSRERLGVTGERSWPVAPLPVPLARESGRDRPAPDASLPAPQRSAAESARSAPAVALFIDRARERDPQFDPSDADVVRIGQLCSRLDGLPLAVELAAARTAVMSVTELIDGLDASLAVLGSVPRGLPAQHDSIDAAIEWSLGSLEPAERGVLAVLASFAGGARRDAIEAVCAAVGGARTTSATGARVEVPAPHRVLDVLDQLVTKSVVGRRSATASRYGLLRTIRRYVWDTILTDAAVAAGDTRQALDGFVGKLRAGHAAWAAAWASDGAPEPYGAPDAAWLAKLDAEAENMRSAVAYALAARDAALSARLVSALWPWCQVRGQYDDGRTWALAVLDLPGITAPALAAERARVLAGAATLAFLQCDYTVARPRIEESMAAYAALGDAHGVAWATDRLGGLERECGAYDTAAAHHERAREMFAALGDRIGEGRALSYLAFVGWLRSTPDDASGLDEAAELCQRALPILTSAGDDEGVVWVLISRGAVLLYRGEGAAADRQLTESLELAYQLGFREGRAWSLDLLGRVALLRGDLGGARELLTESRTIHGRLGDRWRLASVLEALAAVRAAAGRAADAAQLLGAAETIRAQIGAPVPACEQSGVAATTALVRDALGAGVFESEQWAGAVSDRVPRVRDVSSKARQAPRQAARP